MTDANANANATTLGQEGETTPVAILPVAGDRISEKYVVTKRVGEGGMGVVYEAVHLRLRQPVALKFLHPDALAVAESCQRFEREARASGQLKGPHCAHVLDVDVTPDGLPYIVMELLDGNDLEEEMQRRGGCFPLDEAVSYVLQAAAGMAEAHALGIVHRDLKPSNLFLCRRRGGAAPHLKVLDFGISKILADTQINVTATHVSVGTPLYMSPEQVRSSKHVDARSDIWSLGVILYELLAGQPPFMGTATSAIAAIVADETPSLKALRPDIPDELEQLVGKTLKKNPAERFQTVHELAAALAPFCSIEVDMPRLSLTAARPSWSEIPESPALVPALRPIVARDAERDRRVSVGPVATAARARPKRTLVAGPFARFTLPKGRAALAIGVAVLVLPMLTLAGLSRNEPTVPRHVITEGVESPHYMLGESPALPGVRVRNTESAGTVTASAHREREPVQPAAVPPSSPAHAVTRSRTPAAPNQNPLYL
jgi:serine/threonine-protein kinase